MFKPVRVVATIVFLGLLVAIFCVAFLIKNEVSVMHARVSQDLALIAAVPQLLCLSTQHRRPFHCLEPD